MKREPSFPQYHVGKRLAVLVTGNNREVTVVGDRTVRIAHTHPSVIEDVLAAVRGIFKAPLVLEWLDPTTVLVTLLRKEQK